MSTDRTLLTSPVGEIQFMALNNKVSKTVSNDSELGYTVRIKYTNKTKEGAEWEKTIKAINPALVSTKHAEKAGEYTVRAFTKFDPLVLDAQGNEVEEKPNFYANSKGKASMTISPFMGNKLGGAINLVAVTIHELEEGEAPVSTAKEEILSQIRAALANG